MIKATNFTALIQPDSPSELEIAQHFRLTNSIDHFTLDRIEVEIDRINQQARYRGRITDMTDDEIGALREWYSMRLESIEVIGAAEREMKARMDAYNEEVHRKYGSGKSPTSTASSTSS